MSWWRVWKMDFPELHLYDCAPVNSLLLPDDSWGSPCQDLSKWPGSLAVGYFKWESPGLFSKSNVIESLWFYWPWWAQLKGEVSGQLTWWMDGWSRVCPCLVNAPCLLFPGSISSFLTPGLAIDLVLREESLHGRQQGGAPHSFWKRKQRCRGWNGSPWTGPSTLCSGAKSMWIVCFMPLMKWSKITLSVCPTSIEMWEQF